MTKAAAVSIRNVSKTFGKGGTTALQDIELEFQPGEFISLIGPSGCGKSTLLRVIGDLIEPTEGEAIVGGKTAHQARLDRDYGMVFQEATLMDWRTVEKNVSLPLEMMGWDRAARRDRVRELLELVELTGFEDHHPWQLSGGMQQRVAIARALTFNPALILMDEPFGALDEMTRDRLNLELLRIWEATSATVVFVTHSIAEAVFLSSRVVVMSARPGRVQRIVDVDLAVPADERDARGAALLRARDRGARAAARVARCAGRGRDAASAGLSPSGCRRSRSSCSASSAGSSPSTRSGSRSSCSRSRARSRPRSGISGAFSGRPAGTRSRRRSGASSSASPSASRRRSCSRASAPLGSALMPYFIAASAIPIIAFAPIANAWFGIEKSSKIFIAALLCFFPVLVNTLRGLTSVKPQQVELMRSYAAGNAAVFRRVRIPTSLPYVFTSLKVASVLAMIGAIVGEYFGGSQEQLGIQIKNSAALFQFETAWAAILVACILGIGFYLAVSLAEIVTMRRYPSAAERAEMRRQVAG